MRVTIKYRARMTWTWQGKFHENVLCDVVHETEQQDDGSWKTVKLEWEPAKGIIT